MSALNLKRGQDFLTGLGQLRIYFIFPYAFSKKNEKTQPHHNVYNPHVKNTYKMKGWFIFRRDYISVS